MNRLVLIFGLLVWTVSGSIAQIDSVGIGYVRFFAPNVDPMLMEVEMSNLPFQFAEIVEPNMQILPFSERSKDGVTHLLTCHIPNAKSLNANLLIDNESNFELYISNPDKTIEYGPYNYDDFTDNILATPLIPGDEIHFRILCNDIEMPNIVIDRLGYDYIGIATKDANFGRSGACNIDINCAEGAAWQSTKKSVVRLIVATRWLCSGSIVNNLRFDKKGYLLTANHCFSETTHPARTVAYFNYESPTCEGSDGSIRQTVSGMVMRATKDDEEGKIDFALLELRNEIPEDFNVVYAGWDASGRIPENTITIHHPKGDVKKISFDFDAPLNASYPYSGGYDVRSFWKVINWEMGTTEGGSSGSPLYNADQNVIGVLTGGDASCENPENDYYTQLSYAWSTYSDSSQQLKYWLNPDNAPTRVCSVLTALETIEYNRLSTPLQVYPNPATTSISFDWNGVINKKLTIHILDQMGQRVATYNLKTPPSGKIELLVPKIPSGIYLMQVSDGEISANTTVVFQ